jgi:N-acetylmuramoyl-L-alanine amidase
MRNCDERPIMVKRALTFIVVSLVVAHVSAAVPAVRLMYGDALAKEQAVRKALADPHMTDVVLKAVHEVVASYEAVVRHYPASSYSDDALWNAGRLELDAFARFGEQPDKDAAARLFSRLAAAYPSSKLVKQIPRDILRASRTATATTAAPASAAPAAVPAPTPAAPVSVETKERSTPPGKDAPSSIATIKDVRRAVMGDTVRITIELDSEVPFHDERISDPDRLFLDLPSTRPARSLLDRTVRFEGDADIVRQVRIGRHPNNTTRVVLDASGVSSYSVYPLYSPYRLVIDCTRARSAASLRAAPLPATSLLALTARPLIANIKRAPTSSPRAAVSIAEARLEMMPSLPSSSSLASLTAPAPRKETPTAAPSGVPAPALPLTGVSIARQLGLGVSRIVIDPGHGGHDPGAKGKGVSEAELVLDVALRLEKLLTAVPGVEVILTRREDEFIPLQERTAIANREGADLFLSIHANASPNAQARGIETYFLNFANNLSAAAVAARENAASGQAMAALPDFVKAIALNNKIDESKDFATQVQRAMIDKLRGTNRTIRDLGVKQAPFVVLIGAAMPSVLAEISFVTNLQEARLLKSSAYRQKIADALFSAVQKYQTSLKRAQAVAYQ